MLAQPAGGGCDNCCGHSHDNAVSGAHEGSSVNLETLVSACPEAA